MVFYFTQMLLAVVATSLGYMVSAVFPQPEIATEMASTVMLPSIVFGGLMVNLADIPAWLRWL
jgi:hypothetical protein